MSNQNTKLEGVYFEPHDSGDYDLLVIAFQDVKAYSIPVSKNDTKFTIANKLTMLADAIIAEPVTDRSANTIH